MIVKNRTCPHCLREVAREISECPHCRVSLTRVLVERAEKPAPSTGAVGARNQLAPARGMKSSKLRRILTSGPSGSGKTLFKIGALHELEQRQKGNSRCRVVLGHPDPKDETHSFIHKKVRHLKRMTKDPSLAWPEGSKYLQQVYFRFFEGDREWPVEMLDSQGEALNALFRGQGGEEALVRFIETCHGVVLILDPFNAEYGDDIDVLLKAMLYVKDRHIAISLIVTRAKHVRRFFKPRSARSFVEQRYPHLLSALETDFSSVQIELVDAVGRCEPPARLPKEMTTKDPETGETVRLSHLSAEACDKAVEKLISRDATAAARALLACYRPQEYVPENAGVALEKLLLAIVTPSRAHGRSGLFACGFALALLALLLHAAYRFFLLGQV